MPLHFMTVPIHDSSAAETELNAFIGTHRVITVDRRFVEQGVQSFWAICIDFLSGSVAKSNNFTNKERVDYKDKLSEEQFRLFAKLRDLRKEIAQSEGVPVYAVFSNEQLAQMVTDKVKTKTDLSKIDGVGEARVAKYGPKFLELIGTSSGA